MKDFDYILSFDLAKRLTGWSLYCLKDNSVVEAGMISSVDFKEESFWNDYFVEICHILAYIKGKYGPNGKKIVVTKEKMPLQNGPRSTANALLALAMCHSIFDCAVFRSQIPVYDTEGVPAVSEKAFFSNIAKEKNLEISKITKEDIQKIISETTTGLDLNEFSLDVSDSVAVSMTLFYWKEERDIKEKIKELKKEQKKFKSEKKKEEIQVEIEKMKNFLEA